MATPRESMEAQLKALVVPWLRGVGYKGTFPHFRRPDPEGIDLITFQFDRYGGGFIVERARCPAQGITTLWGKHIAPARVSAWDMHPNDRTRIQPRVGPGTDSWFRFEDAQFEECAQQLLKLLRSGELTQTGAQNGVVPSA